MQDSNIYNFFVKFLIFVSMITSDSTALRQVHAIFRKLLSDVCYNIANMVNGRSLTQANMVSWFANVLVLS